MLRSLLFQAKEDLAGLDLNEVSDFCNPLVSFPPKGNAQAHGRSGHILDAEVIITVCFCKFQ